MTKELDMYFDDYEWVIAHSPEDATQVCIEQTGEGETSHLDGTAITADERWRKLSSDKELEMFVDANGDIAGEDDHVGGLKKLTVREWIAKNGRGWLGTTEM